MTDLSPQAIFQKLSDFRTLIKDMPLVTTPTQTSVQGLTLNRQDLQEQLVIQAPTSTPVRNRIRRIPGNGQAHSFYRMVANFSNAGPGLDQGYFFGTTPSAGFFAKGGLPNNTDASYTYVALPYYNLGDIANVTFQDVSQGRSYWDLYKSQQELRAINVALMEEWAIINGDNTVNPLVFDGITKQIFSYGGQVLASGGALSLGAIRHLQRATYDVGGSPDLLVMSTMAKAVITSLIMQIMAIRQVGPNAPSPIDYGVEIDSYNFGYGRCDLLQSRYILANPYNNQDFLLSLDTKSQDAKNGGNVITMVDVDPMNGIDLAILGTSYRRLVWETTMCMVTAPAFQGILTGLTYAGQTLGAGPY